MVYSWLLTVAVSGLQRTSARRLLDERVLSSQWDVGWRNGFDGPLQSDSHWSQGSSKMTPRVVQGQRKGTKNRL